ncbi:hypothetical protein PABG_11539 [Paracoccidioides brasiliensis Pb03]|nr:hypothetical protein PABG_11539 [Paracoccidioides brasiliensis Pb03]
MHVRRAYCLQKKRGGGGRKTPSQKELRQKLQWPADLRMLRFVCKIFNPQALLGPQRMQMHNIICTQSQPQIPAPHHWDPVARLDPRLRRWLGGFLDSRRGWLSLPGWGPPAHLDRPDSEMSSLIIAK